MVLLHFGQISSSLRCAGPITTAYLIWGVSKKKTVKRSALKAFSKARKRAATDVELSVDVAVLDGIFSLKEQLTALKAFFENKSNPGPHYHYKNTLLCMRFGFSHGTMGLMQEHL